jgi:tripartite-type tricarboxylate transporter receptor subunit TctC
LREFYTAVCYAKTCTPISMIGASPYVLAVYPGLAVNTVTELITLAKAKPRRLNNAAFGSNSVGAGRVRYGIGACRKAIQHAASGGPANP